MLSQAYKGSKIRSKSYTFCSKVIGTVRRPIGFRPPSDRFPSAVRSDSVRRPIGFRPPSDRIPSAVRLVSVRCTTRKRKLLIYRKQREKENYKTNLLNINNNANG